MRHEKGGQARLATISPYALLSSGAIVSAHDAANEINSTFTKLANAGATGAIWHAAACGKSLYRTKVATPFSGDHRYSGRRLEAMLSGMDFLETAVAAARKAKIQLFLAARPYDDYFPGLGSRFEAEHQQYLWESRDGEARLRGVISMAYDEAREYRLGIVEELAGYGAEGIVIDLETTAAAMTPFRRRDFFGFNEPIAAEHRRRFGEDIRAFDDVEYRRGPDLQVTDAIYAGGEFNRAGWHTIKGEFFGRFLAEASAAVKARGGRLGLSMGREEGIMPMARMELPIEQWLTKGVIDDLVLPRGAGEDRDTSAFIRVRGPKQRIITPKGWADSDGWIAHMGEVLQKTGSADNCTS